MASIMVSMGIFAVNVSFRKATGHNQGTCVYHNLEASQSYPKADHKQSSATMGYRKLPRNSGRRRNITALVRAKNKREPGKR